MGMIVAIFGVGANISIYRDENKNAADNGIFYGIILSMLIFSVIIFNSNKYISGVAKIAIGIPIRIICLKLIFLIISMYIIYTAKNAGISNHDKQYVYNVIPIDIPAIIYW